MDIALFCLIAVIGGVLGALFNQVRIILGCSHSEDPVNEACCMACMVQLTTLCVLYRCVSDC
jgi:hypothetical protein